MRAVPQVPQVHFFVCANRRAPAAVLGPGCGDAGEGVYHALKDHVARTHQYQSVWVTQTKCLGICPKEGATVAIYNRSVGAAFLTEVMPADASKVFTRGVVSA